MVERINTSGASAQEIAQAIKAVLTESSEMSKTTLKIKTDSSIYKAAENIDGLVESLERYNKYIEKKGNNHSKTAYFTTEEKAIYRLKNAWETYAKERNAGLINDSNLAKSDSAKKVLVLANALEALTGKSSSISEVSKDIANLVFQMREMPNFKDYNLSVDQLKEAFSFLKDIQKYYPDVSEIIKPFKGLEGVIESLTPLMSASAYASNSASSAYNEQAESAEKVTHAIKALTEAEMERKLKSEHKNVEVYDWDINLDDSLSDIEKYSKALDELKANQKAALEWATYYQNKMAKDPDNSETPNRYMDDYMKEYHKYTDQIEFVQKRLQESIREYTPNAGGETGKELNALIVILKDLHNEIVKIGSAFSEIGSNSASFTPVLEMIEKINSSILEMSTNVKNIGFNMNLDVGTDAEIDAKVQSKISNALQAYHNLFEHIKMSSVGGSIINTKFFDFDINQYDTMMGKLMAYRKFINDMREEAKKQYNGKDVLFEGTDKKFWTSASSSMGQITKVFNEMKDTSDSNPLTEMFGKSDLIEVISQLELIVTKLNEISSTALEFKNSFAEGFNVSTSIENINNLTNRIKELEDELDKIKTPSIENASSLSGDQSSVLSGNQTEVLSGTEKELDEIAKSENSVNDSLNQTDDILKRILSRLSSLSGFRQLIEELQLAAQNDNIETALGLSANGKIYNNKTRNSKGKANNVNPIGVYGNAKQDSAFIEALGHTHPTGLAGLSLVGEVELEEWIKNATGKQKALAGDIIAFYNLWKDKTGQADQQVIAGINELQVFDAKGFYEDAGIDFSDKDIKAKIAEETKKFNDSLNFEEYLKSYLNEINAIDILRNNILNSLSDYVASDNDKLAQFKEALSKLTLDDVLSSTDMSNMKTFVKSLNNIDDYLMDYLDKFGLNGYDISKRRYTSGDLGISDIKDIYQYANNKNMSSILKSALSSNGYNINIDDYISSMSYEQIYSYIDKIISGNNEIVNSAKQAIDAEQNISKEVNQTPLSLVEESSGQLAMFEGVEEQQKEVKTAVEKTNDAIEGQIDLQQYLASIEDKDTSISEISEMDKVTTATDDAVQAKKDFVTANEGVRDSVDGSKSKLELEAELMESVAKNAREAAKAKKDFVKSNKEVKDSANTSSDSIKNETSSIEESTNASKKNKKSKTDSKIKGIESAGLKVDSFFNYVKSDDTEKAKYEKIANEITDIINKQGKYTSSIEETIDETKRLEYVTQKFVDMFQKGFSDNQVDLAEKFNNKITRITSGKNFDEETSSIINNINNNIEKLKDVNIFDINDISSAQEVARLISEIDKNINQVKNVSNNPIHLLPEPEDINRSIGQINKILSGRFKIPRKLKGEFEELRIAYKNAFDESGNVKITNAELQRLDNTLSKLNAEFEATGKHKTILGSLTSRITDMNAKFLAQYFSFQDILRYAQQAYQYVADIDKQMIELEKVSDMSASRLAESFNHAKESAKDLGSTVSDVISATADWSRLGYNADEAEQLAEVATIYKNVGDGIDISTANESLISTLQGFQMEASQAMEIVDSFNEVANRMPIDSAGIGEALQRSAASFNAANTDLNSSIALITATNAVIQDPTSVGTMWKTVSARIRGAKAELEEAGLETDGMVESTSKLRDLVKGMTGFDIMEDEDTFKSIYDIMVGIGEEWENLSDIDQAALLEALAGKRAGNALAAALQNVDMLKEAYQIAEGSSGSARKEQEKWEQGLEARTNKLKASLETLSTTVLDSDFLGGAIDAGRGFIDVLTEIIDTLGLIPTLLTAGGGIFAAMQTFKGKGEGRVKKFTLMNMPSVA